METQSKLDQVEKHDLSNPKSRTILERKADKLLRDNGFSVLSPKDENRKTIRRSKILMEHLADPKLQELHGAFGSVSSSKKRMLTNKTHVEAVKDIMHKPSAEDVLLSSFLPEDFDATLIFLFDNIFNDDKIARIIMIDILKNDSKQFRNTKNISATTGLSMKQIISAKARIRYKLRNIKVSTVDELVGYVKGELK